MVPEVVAVVVVVWVVVSIVVVTDVEGVVEHTLARPGQHGADNGPQSLSHRQTKVASLSIEINLSELLSQKPAHIPRSRLAVVFVVVLDSDDVAVVVLCDVVGLVDGQKCW